MAYNNWISLLDLQGESSNQPTDDMNLDGFPNFFSYAFGLNPKELVINQGQIQRYTTINIGDTQFLTLTTPVIKNAVFVNNINTGLKAITSNLVYLVQGSGDLYSWDIPVEEYTPTLDHGLVTLPDLNRDDLSDWSYRTFILQNPLELGKYMRITIEWTN